MLEGHFFCMLSGVEIAARIQNLLRVKLCCKDMQRRQVNPLVPRCFFLPQEEAQCCASMN